MKNKNRICWITASYMLQVDLPLLATLTKDFNIDWYFWGNRESSTGKTALKYAEDNNIPLNFIEKGRFIFHPGNFFDQKEIIKGLAKLDYSIYYFDISTFPWMLSLIKRYIPENKVVIAMHHGKPHSGMRFKPLYFPFLKYINKQNCYLQYFSNNQAEAYAGGNIDRRYIIPLALNDFGVVSAKPRDDGKVVFTVFGNIIPSKNIGLLISAANKLWEEYAGKFVVKIVGHCKNWQSVYQPLIKYGDAFELDIRRIEESEIPKLFGESHYLVLPYKSVTQSGPLRIAYGYNVPVIASDLDGFKESVVEDVTGLLFSEGDIDSLYSVMRSTIENHPLMYDEIKRSQKRYVDENLSTKSVCDQYVKMFNEILSDRCQ